jgi:hypothetical protein
MRRCCTASMLTRRSTPARPSAQVTKVDVVAHTFPKAVQVAPALQVHAAPPALVVQL